MKKAAAVLAAAIALAAASAAPRAASPQVGKISPALRTAIAAAAERAAAPLKVWVYFLDKGPASVSPALAEAGARAMLAPRALARRAKVRSESGLVDLDDSPLDPVYVEAVRSVVSKLRAESRWLNAVSVEASASQVAALETLPFVSAIDVVRGFRRGEERLGPPSGGSGGQPPAEIPWFQRGFYGLAFRQVDQIKVRALHAAGLTGRGVIVGMLDVGFRKTHEAFRFARLAAERDFVMGDGDVQRDLANSLDYSDAHGTATWSLLGGLRPGLLVGPAFGADFVLAKTEDDRSETPVEEDYWAAGIEWAEALGADVISSSLGYTDWYAFRDMDGRTAVTTRAANRAVSLGVVVVNAAGNERRTAWGHIIAPADGFDVIAVGAVEPDGTISSFSSPGPTYDGRIKPEVCAMGVNDFVAASTPTSGDAAYQIGAGTSYATPLVAGVVALLLEAHPSWTPRQVREALLETAGNSASPNNDYGWGVVNAAAARAYKAPIR